MPKLKPAGFNEKVQFVKQFLCNGPELDVDTIVHYRNIILDDEEYSSIATDYFSNIDTIDDIRINEFGKDTAKTSDNCFLNPCNYLDNLSVNLGAMGDPANFRTVKNILSLIVGNKKEEQNNQSNGQNNQSNDQNNQSDNQSHTPRQDVDSELVNGSIRPTVLNKILPGVKKGYMKLQGSIMDQLKTFADDLAKTRISLDLVEIGDCNAVRNADDVSVMVKSNIFTQIGDCGRVWNNLRTLNAYNPQQNTIKPAPSSAEVGNKTISGTPKKKPINKSDASATPANVKVETKTEESNNTNNVLPSNALTALSDNSILADNTEYFSSSGVEWNVKNQRTLTDIYNGTIGTNPDSPNRYIENHPYNRYKMNSNE